jgi:hypothetical protein
MLELAGAPLDARERKLTRSLYATGFRAANPLQAHRDLIETAEEACPQIPAGRCDQIVRFYFTAALAANEITPRQQWIEATEEGEPWILISGRQASPRELQLPRSPRLISTTFGTGKTEMISRRLLQAFSERDPAPVSLSQTQGAITSQLQAITSQQRAIGAQLAQAPAQAFVAQQRAIAGQLVEAHRQALARERLIAGQLARSTFTAVEPFRAFNDLKEWLNLTTKQLAGFLGIKRTTPNAWDREGRKPRHETQLRLDRLHSYIAELANKPDSAERLARIRPALPMLMKAIEAEAAINSSTLDSAGVEIPLDWRRLNAFQAANKIEITEDEDGKPIVKAPPLTAVVTEEDEDDLDLRY